MTITDGRKRNLIAVVVAASILTVGAVAAAVMTGAISRLSPVAAPEQSTVTSSAPAGPTTSIRKHTPVKAPVRPAEVASVAVLPPPCANCGVVDSIDNFTEKGDASGGGAVAGGLIGGILGHQIGKGRGKDLATLAGTVGGAIAGHEMEKNANKVTRYRVGVRMTDGTRELLTLNTSPTVAVGDRVRVVNGEPVRD